MVRIDECTVRYLLTKDEPRWYDLIHQFKSFVYSDYNKDWLPEMIVYSDDEFVWAYFAVPLADVEKRLIRAFTMFDLSIEERLV